MFKKTKCRIFFQRTRNRFQSNRIVNVMKEIIQLQLQLQLQLYYVFFLKKLHLQFLGAAGSIANLGGKLFLPAAQEADLLEDEP